MKTIPSKNQSYMFFKIIQSIMVASILFLGLGIQSLSSVHALAKNLYVSTSGSDASNCLSWETACRTIQAAINKALDGDTINVASGLYQEHVLIQSRSSISLLGTGAQASTIDGGLSGHVISILSSAQITLSGFTIQNGGQTYQYTDSTVNSGIRILNSSVSIDHLIVRANYNGVYINTWTGTGNSLNLTNATIADNYGTGIFIVETPSSLKNNIIAFNDEYGIYNWNGASVISHSYNDVYGNFTDFLGVSVETGEISSDPLFVDSTNGNYHLNSCSPTIDSGDPSSDYSNEPIPNGSRIDMGAYGNTAEAVSYWCSVALPFYDDFSTNRGWIDASGGNIYRDGVSESLSWKAERDHQQRYYIPIKDANKDRITLSFRFKVTGAAGNGGIYVGLAETLDAPATIWAADATGVFVGLNRDTAYGTKIPFLALYSDGTMDGIDNQVSTLNYGSLNVWRRLRLSIIDGSWRVVLMDDGGVNLGTMSGSLSGNHTAYNYLMVFMDYTPGWEWETGYLDDVEISTPLNAAFTSVNTHDGWILEKSETANTGGTMNSTANTISLGDDAADKQYRGILSFNTSSLPEGAVILSATIKIKRSTYTGTNPFSTHGKLYCDIKKGSFGTASLALTDFSSTTNMKAAGTFTPITSSWYSATLTNSALAYINTTGLTQCRLRFAKDDNDDRGADILQVFSGNTSTTSNRPVLFVEYYVP